VPAVETAEGFPTSVEFVGLDEVVCHSYRIPAKATGLYKVRSAVVFTQIFAEVAVKLGAAGGLTIVTVVAVELFAQVVDPFETEKL
jgi:hypothetical protein